VASKKWILLTKTLTIRLLSNMSKLKIAFDCSGTLTGRDEKKVVALYKWFQSKGCEMFIWSNLYSYTTLAKNAHNLEGECLSKYGAHDWMDVDKDWMDICVDDDSSQTWLKAHRMICVNDIPSNEGEFESKFGHYFTNNL
jgi:hypothetical protein